MIMIKSTVEKLAHDLGFEVGNSDDQAQSEIINGLSKGLCNSMDDSTLEKQLCFVVDKLDSRSHKVIKILHDFIELKEKD